MNQMIITLLENLIHNIEHGSATKQDIINSLKSMVQRLKG